MYAVTASTTTTTKRRFGKQTKRRRHNTLTRTHTTRICIRRVTHLSSTTTPTTTTMTTIFIWRKKPNVCKHECLYPSANINRSFTWKIGYEYVVKLENLYNPNDGFWSWDQNSKQNDSSFFTLHSSVCIGTTTRQKNRAQFIWIFLSEQLPADRYPRPNVFFELDQQNGKIKGVRKRIVQNCEKIFRIRCDTNVFLGGYNKTHFMYLMP